MAVVWPPVVTSGRYTHDSLHGDINIDRAEKWKKKPLQKTAGLAMTSVLRNVRSLYKELLEVLDIAASVKVQSGIKARNPVCETILDKCAAIADEWKKGSHHMFEEDSMTLSDYHEVVRYAYRSPCEIFSVDISFC